MRLMSNCMTRTDPSNSISATQTGKNILLFLFVSILCGLHGVAPARRGPIEPAGKAAGWQGVRALSEPGGDASAALA